MKLERFLVLKTRVVIGWIVLVDKKFRSIFKVHCIIMIPLASPNKSILLEYIDYKLRYSVFIL